MSITPVPISMRPVLTPIAARSGNGAESCRPKWWTRTNAPSMPISSAAIASSTVWRRASPAFRAAPPAGCQAPNERNPMRFRWPIAVNRSTRRVPSVNLSVLLSTFLAATIEVIEMVAIVVAVGVTRSWRASLAGAVGGLLVLAVLVASFGIALQSVPLKPIRLGVGALLLAFGSQWLRKGILRVSLDGWAKGFGEEHVEAGAADGFDWTGLVLSFKGVSLEGLEVAVIVVAFGAADRAIGAATVGAAASVIVVAAIGLAGYRFVARIPRRALQLFVGAML